MKLNVFHQLMFVLVVWVLGAALPVVQAEPIKPTIYYQAESGNTSLTQLIDSPLQQWRTIPEGEAVSFGYTPQAYWFRMHIEASDADRILYLGYPLLDSIDAYFVRNGQVIHKISLGDQQPFAERPVHNKNFVVPVPTHAAHDLYIRVRTESSLRFPLELWEPLDFMEANQYQVAATGLYFGLLLCMAIYNLSNFLVTREISFLNYSAYTLSIGLLMAGLDGVGYQYLWPNWIWLQDRIVTMIGSIMIMFATLVTMGVLQTKIHSLTIHKWLRRFMVVYGITFVLSVFLPYATADENFQAWMEEYRAGGLVRRCDGETCVFQRDAQGRAITAPTPCARQCACKQDF